MSATVIVTRRIPTYRFVIRTSRSVRENAELLESYLANQKPPRGFVVHDPRLGGQIAGSTFSLREYGAWMWGSMTPTIEGEIIPNERGSDVLVEIVHDRVSAGVIAILLVVVAIAFFLDGLDRQSAGYLVYAIAVAGAASLLPIVFHGQHAARVFGSIFLPASNLPPFRFRDSA